MATKKAANRAYNIGRGVGVSVNDLFQMMAAITGYTQKPIYGPDRLGEISRSVLTRSSVGMHVLPPRSASLSV